MIYLITKAKKTYTFLSYLNTWGKDLKSETKFLPFEKFVRKKNFSPGTYILTDYDLLSPKQTQILAKIYNTLNNSPHLFKILNHPTKSLGRLELLKKLNESDFNPFRCFTANNKPEDIHFPVFIRKGKDHYGKITDLIKDNSDLNKSISEIKREGFNESEILITEFVDTKDETGVFRKYSAFRIDSQIVARHIFFSKHWMIKGADLVNEKFLKEEYDYVKNNDFKNQILAIFEAAGMNYGRIDYSILNGKIITWEINPNPMIASSSSLKKSKRKRTHDLFARHFNEAFNIANTTNHGTPVKNPVTAKEAPKVFPFISIQYFISRQFHNLKSILLYQFYLNRNRIFK